jgi:hypothetical protein
MHTTFNKMLYLGFIVLGIYQVLFAQDYMQASASMGIALAFDPFNPQQKWHERPIWQKAVLILHLILVATLFVGGMWLKNI